MSTLWNETSKVTRFVTRLQKETMRQTNFNIWYAAVLILTLTSMFGMLSKPIKDWIPEFPALHRWIIPGFRMKTNKDM